MGFRQTPLLRKIFIDFTVRSGKRGVEVDIEH